MTNILPFALFRSTFFFLWVMVWYLSVCVEHTDDATISGVNHDTEVAVVESLECFQLTLAHSAYRELELRRLWLFYFLTLLLRLMMLYIFWNHWRGCPRLHFFIQLFGITIWLFVHVLGRHIHGR